MAPGRITGPLLVCVVALLLVVGGADAWWENANFYQIYPRSFKDSDGDGVGDLNGVTQQLGYLKDIGITATWLSPIFRSPMKDFGYDCSDYYSIQSEYGTLDDFDRLIARARELDVKIILDFVPNHTSDLHEWFIKSEAGDEKYKDFYIWNEGKKLANGTRVPPNNWVSVFRGSAWTYSEKRDAFYFHAFLKEQPDLNYRNKAVVDEMKNVLRFWLSRGVSGFRIDAVPYLFEAQGVNGVIPDEELTGPSCPDPNADCYTKHTLTQNLDETFDMTFQWRSVLQDFTVANKTEEKVLMLEAYTPINNVMRLFGENGKNGSQIPFNFELISKLSNRSTTQEVYNTINTWLKLIPDKNVSNWVIGNHDNKRPATRFGIQRADAVNFLIQTLPGVGVTYYGEELGLEDVEISWADTIDPAGCNTSPEEYTNYSRDPVRTPMPWNAEKNAGFSTADRTWLPVAPNYKTRNVVAQKAAAKSHLKSFMKLTYLRRTEAALKSKFINMTVHNNVLIYTRYATYGDVLVVALNLGSDIEKLDIHEKFPHVHSDSFVVEVASLASPNGVGKEFGKDLTLAPYEALVLRGSRPNSATTAVLGSWVILLAFLVTMLIN